MRFGVREICDVVLRAKAVQKIGNKVFYKDEPVLYFDSLKTSSLEGAATTVYAQGGRGNSRLIAWEGERTITFTMEDALISPAGFSILSGAGLIDVNSNNKIKVHTTERTADVEFVAAGEEYEDYSTFDLVTFENGRSVWEVWENPHQPIANINTYYFDVLSQTGAGSWKKYDDLICHQCTSNDPDEDGKYTWFSLRDNPAKNNYDIAYAVSNDLYGFIPQTITAERNMVFIYFKNKPYYQVNNLQKYSDSQAAALDPELQLSAPIYVMRMINDEVVTEPFYADPKSIQVVSNEESPHYGEYRIALKVTDDLTKGFVVVDSTSYDQVKFEDKGTDAGWNQEHLPSTNVEYYYQVDSEWVRGYPKCDEGYIGAGSTNKYYWFEKTAPQHPDYVLAHAYYTRTQTYKLDDKVVAFLDYYTEKSAGYQIDITPDKFGGNYYLEASTLFRDTNGVDLPAEFIIPNCKIQSNFTFSMASSGDPSTFTFTMDAFPDYTRFNPTKKVLVSIQILDTSSAEGLDDRDVTGSEWKVDSGAGAAVRDKTWSGKQPIND